jgi:anti-anti-sigma factor
MPVSINKHDNYSIVLVEEDKLDATVAPELKSVFVVADKNNERNYILDLSNVEYCDSSGLSAVLVGNRLSKYANGTFVICGVQKAVAKLLSISQLDQVLNIVPTVSEAIDFLFMEELEKDLGEDFDDEL